MNVIDLLEREQLKAGVPEFRPGDTVKVYSKVVEGGKERTQMFEGVVTVRRGGAIGETITVRREVVPPAQPARREDRSEQARHRPPQPLVLPIGQSR
jgi:hypothetical protein